MTPIVQHPVDITVDPVLGAANPLSATGGFAVLVRHDATLGGTAAASLAVGGAVTGTDARIHPELPAEPGGRPVAALIDGAVSGSGAGTALTVAGGQALLGDIGDRTVRSIDGGIGVFAADAPADGDPLIRIEADQSADAVTAPGAFDRTFAGVFEDLQARSRTIAQLPPTVSPTDADGDPLGDLAGADVHLALRDGVNAWTIDSATLSTIGHLTVSPAPSARSPLVITVTGESTVLGTPGLAAADAGSILWNLPAATSVTVLTPTVGAVLAPSAAVELAADLTGSVVAGSLAQDKGTTVAAAAFAAELPTTARATDPDGASEQAAADTTMPGLIAAAEPQADDGLISVLAVPPATGNNAVITAKVGGDRTGTSGVTSLAGVVLQLYDGTNAPTTPTTAVSPNTCTSDAAGDCSWIVPNTQTGSSGTNRDKRFWVKQVSAPAGWFMNSAFVTGMATTRR